VSDDEIVDPWSGLAGEDTLARVKAEEGFTVAVDNADEFANNAFTDAPQNGSLRIVGADIDMDDEGLFSALRALVGVAQRVTSLSLSGNNLSSLGALSSLSRLRGLSAGGNPLTSWHAPNILSGCRCLVELDLSYTYGLGALLADNGLRTSGSASPFAHLGDSLLSLNLASCGLSTLALTTSVEKDMKREAGEGDGDATVGEGSGSTNFLLGGLSLLLELSLAENELDDLDMLLSEKGLGPVATTLQELDCQENPMNDGESEPVYRRRLLAAAAVAAAVPEGSSPERASAPLALPRLQRLDGKGIAGVATGASRTLGDVTGGQCLGLDEKSTGILGDAPAMAALEMEVDAALKGHRDMAVIT